MLRGRAAWLVALTGILACASSAQAYTVTLGPSDIPSAPPEEGFICKGGCAATWTVAQRSSSSVDVAPAAGVITNWRVNAEAFSPVQLRVIEPSPSGGWVGGGTSAYAADLAGGPNATEMAIERGDLIGADLGFGAFVGANLEVGGEILKWKPLLGEGGGGRAADFTETDRLLLSAEVELTPVVTSVSPASGSTAGGDMVTITGKYLDSALNVVFGSRPATTFSVDLSGERITAKAPASTAGTVDVHVSNLHSTSETVAADRFTFVAPTTPPTGSAPPGGSGGSAQTRTPIVTGFSESAGRWRLGSSLQHIGSTPLGTAFAFRLNEPASVALTFTRVLPGRRAGGRCVALSHRNRGRPKCKRNMIVGSLAVSGHAGSNTVRFRGRLSPTSKLTPGDYTASVTTRDSHGLKTLTRSLNFTIVP